MKSSKDSFIYLAHCEESNGKPVPSSKRFNGTIGYMTVQLCLVAATVLSLIKTGELSSIISGLLEFDLVTSASLVGLSTIMGAFGGGRKMSIGTTKEAKDEDDSYDEE